ncbi:hypothetical protein SEP9_082 [Staphylococcus phage vB_SepS_SEP9]|uniref:Uncharacterized protein n=1 Tax=Staphylococcus phage vB_SepS_SEP9 TaxID=1434319 RepID=W5RV49_9CAUD|nr:hypothetical protein SEP9_082 [Staphylococcus phage vB_SepS_SEP9]AHG24003.1 hypothetical protein SEP9_082 [Staphylococcus phage vB_SepS_SEP9]
MAKIVDSRYSKHEAETTCSYDKELNRWIIYSSNIPHITRLCKIYDNVEIIEETKDGVPALVKVVLYEDLITFRSGKK